MVVTDKKSKTNIMFIINPISGGKEKTEIENKIRNAFETLNYNIQIEYPRHKNHATEIAKKSITEKYDVVVAVGGDGTVNETAKALIGTNILFGIIPTGSGNGLARFLKISMRQNKAIHIIKNRNTIKIDTVKINDEYFINIAGLGFDALIGHLFANYGKRGFISYLRLILKEYFQYKNENYELVIDNKSIKVKALLVSFANSSQFGNEAHIAPLALINDGLVDVCILEKFPWWKSFFLAFLLYTKGLTRSKYYSLIKTEKVLVKNTQNLKAHIDGDPITFNSDIHIVVDPSSLNIIIP